MSVERYIGDNGELVRYEMRARGKRSYRKAQLKDIAVRFLIVLGGMGVLLVAILVGTA